MSEAEDGVRSSGLEGTSVRLSGKDGPQIVSCSDKRWNDAIEDRFLNALGASCNVTYAVRACGLSKAAVYKRRRTDAGFAERWHAALSQGYVRVEMLLLDLAERTLAGKMPDPECPIPPMTVREAMTLLQLHQATVLKNGHRRRKWNARTRDMTEVRESILVRLEAIANMPADADTAIEDVEPAT